MADLKAFENTQHQETTKQSIGKTIENPFRIGLEEMMRAIGFGRKTKEGKGNSNHLITPQLEKFEARIRKRRIKSGN